MAIYNMMIITLATYIPMWMQMFSLIFGFVRNKQVKLFRSFHEREHKSPRNDQVYAEEPCDGER